MDRDTQTTDDPWPENRARLEATFEGAAMLDKPITAREPTPAELRRAASEWCAVMNRGPDYVWFLQNWRLGGLRPFVDREMQSLAERCRAGAVT